MPAHQLLSTCMRGAEQKQEQEEEEEEDEEEEEEEEEEQEEEEPAWCSAVQVRSAWYHIFHQKAHMLHAPP